MPPWVSEYVVSVDGLDDGEAIGQLVDRCVVARVDPDEQLRVLHVRKVAQDLDEVLGIELTRSPGAGGEARETDIFLLHNFDYSGDGHTAATPL